MEEQGEPVIQVTDSEDELDRSSSIHTFVFIVARVASGSKEEEEEEMPLERKKGSGLRALLVGRSKGSVPKDVSGSELPPTTPPINSFTPTNLKNKKKGQ